MNEKNWIVKIYSQTLNTFGTGFLIGNGKYIFSCAHVFMNKEKTFFHDLKNYKFTTVENKIIEVEKYTENDHIKNDFVIIKLKNKINNISFPEINHNFNYSIFENKEAKAFGFGEIQQNEPTSINFKITDKVNSEGIVLIDESRPVIGGDSGAPVIFENKVIGWVVARANYKSGEDKKQIYTGFIQFFSDIYENVKNYIMQDINVLKERKLILEEIIKMEKENIDFKTMTDKELLDKLINLDKDEFEEFCRTNFNEFYKRKYTSTWSPLARVNAIMDFFMRNPNEKSKCIEFLK